MALRDDILRTIMMRRDGAMDMARRGNNRSQRGGNRGGRMRSDGRYPMNYPMWDMNDYDENEMNDGKRGRKRYDRNSNDYEGNSSSQMGSMGGSYQDGRRGRSNRRRRDRGEMPFTMEGKIEYEDEIFEKQDHGRYGNDYRGGNDYDNDYNYEEDFGYDYGYNDYEMPKGKMRLTKQDIMKWKQKMVNADGTRGEHFTLEKIMPVAQKHNIKFDEYSEKEFCLVANMLYSDYCEVNRAYISPENELNYYVKLAKAWLEDEDAPEPSEKLALYYYCIIDAE